MMAPEGVSTCRSKSAKGEWVEKVFDYVIACSSLRGRNSDMQVMEDFESRPHKAVTFCSPKRKREAGMERAKIAEEEDYQEEARKRKVGKKEKKAKKANKGRTKMSKSKKELEALRKTKHHTKAG